MTIDLLALVGAGVGCAVCYWSGFINGKRWAMNMVIGLDKAEKRIAERREKGDTAA